MSKGTVRVICRKHSHYKGAAEPRVACGTCWALYFGYNWTRLRSPMFVLELRQTNATPKVPNHKAKKV